MFAKLFGTCWRRNHKEAQTATSKNRTGFFKRLRRQPRLQEIRVEIFEPNQPRAESVQTTQINCPAKSWRMQESSETASVALVLCLVTGVDPADVVKPNDKVECWIDLSSTPPEKAKQLIVNNLVQQYRQQSNIPIKYSVDPTVKEIKELCTKLRTKANGQRVLFHYNGHGVPRPTATGEIYVVNETRTQYTPLSIYDLQTWMSVPSIYVYDCSNAGLILKSFKKFAAQRERMCEQRNVGASTNYSAEPIKDPTNFKTSIQFAACAANQSLPINPQLPADVFTSCLTTPIRMAVKWYSLQPTSILARHLPEDLFTKIPGRLNDRRTMLGELNWIFTAVTDTIAWNTLPRELFQKLFRQDKLVAKLFRNFLLAERVLHSYGCTPISSPRLPQSFLHFMWSAWDLALDMALSQLPDILAGRKVYQPSPFFEDQLTGFKIYLQGGRNKERQPELLPILLQALLHPVYRLRSLELLCHFLDRGPNEVRVALSVGIFPCMLSLLQSPAKELRPFLVLIWAKILAVDGNYQVKLIPNQRYRYFLATLKENSPCPPDFKGNYRVYATFVLASIVQKMPVDQMNAVQELLPICHDQLGHDNFLLRQWSTICLAHLWQIHGQASWYNDKLLLNEKLYTLLSDPIPEVRTAAVYALGMFIRSVDCQSQAVDLLNRVRNDVSPLVRVELVASLQWMVIFFENQFIKLFLQKSFSDHLIKKTWKGLNVLARDLNPAVAAIAQKVVEYVKMKACSLVKQAFISEQQSSDQMSQISIPQKQALHHCLQHHQQQQQSQNLTPIVSSDYIEWSSRFLISPSKAFE